MVSIKCTAKFQNIKQPYKQKTASITIPDTSTSIPKNQLWDSLSHKTNIPQTQLFNNWEMVQIDGEFINTPWNDLEDLKEKLKQINNIRWARIAKNTPNEKVFKIGIKQGKSTKIIRDIQSVYDKLIIGQGKNQTLTVRINPKQIIRTNE